MNSRPMEAHSATASAHDTSNAAVPRGPALPLPRVVVATTAMLSFISFWRVAAIVLGDLGSSAYYAGGIAEQAIGKAAPWFILAIMLFSYAVRSAYIESCSMFVRGGVYPVVKKAMGGTLAKFAVSALLFDFVLTGPISGVSAGHYLAGFLNEILSYSHFNLVLPTNLTAAGFAVLATIYFWWQNVKGIPTSSLKAMRIMQVTSVMVILLIAWCGYTLWVRGGQLPPWPRPANLDFSAEALGWLRGTGLEQTFAVLGIFIALGHSVLAMSGEETLAQVYREIAHPKLVNLKRAALTIFIFSVVFTPLVSFFSVMIIPDEIRKNFLDDLIGGLAMNVVGALPLKLAFHAFVVLVGVLILSGAVNTAIVGSNGVLNRVSEDGVLADWFRCPHMRFGTSYRIITLVAALQVLTIVLSRGNVYALGEAYAFGVIWSFALQVLAVLVLRYRSRTPRDYRVPLNLKMGAIEIPLGLGLIALTLLALAIVNLFTKPTATVFGVLFTLIFFGVLTMSQQVTSRRAAAHVELDQFHLTGAEELSTEAVGCRAGNALVMINNYRRLDHLEFVLERVHPEHQDIVALHIRVREAGAWGERGIAPQQLFASDQQLLFTRALALSEKQGKTIHLALLTANNLWDGMLRAAQRLQSSGIVVGPSEALSPCAQAHRADLAWERLPSPRPTLTFEVVSSTARRDISYLGAHAPRLTPKEIELVHRLWLRFSEQLGSDELHHHDIVHFSLTEIERELAQGRDKELLGRLKQHLDAIRSRRTPHS